MKSMFCIAVALTAILAGCSHPALEARDEAMLEQCVSDLRMYVHMRNEVNSYKPADRTNDEFKRIRAEEYSVASAALADTERYLERVKASGKREKFEWAHSKDERGCPLNQIRSNFDAQSNAIYRRQIEANNQKVYADLDRTNREIDQAQDAVINEYKRKAVKHLSAAGPGPKVDTFVMKNGSIVTCKTTITNGGKAVDCN